MDGIRPEWVEQITEEVIDPDRAIVDPHHHLFPPGFVLEYGLDELRGDTGCGHRVVATVFVECHACYRQDGPEHLRPVGETEFVASAAAELRRDTPAAAPIAGIVAHADLRLGDRTAEAIDAHEQAGNGLFRGIRHAGSHALEPESLLIPGRAPRDLYRNPSFQEGVRELGRRGLTYDTWHYHYQNRDFAALARAAPDTTLILDHLGTPLGVGSFAGRRDEIFVQWKSDIAEIARCENVVAKIGGLAMPDNGFGWHTADRPPTSDEFIEAQGRYYEHMIDCFGPDRCMFESNFPVDKLSLAYGVLWNAFKKMTSAFSEAERDAMFSGTAKRVYRL